MSDTLDDMFAEIERDRKARPIYYFFWDKWNSLKRGWDSFWWFVQRDIPHRIRWGHSQQDIWALYYTLAKWIVPRLKSQRAWFVEHPAIPTSLDGYYDATDNLGHEIALDKNNMLYSKWLTIQDEIIGAFFMVVWLNDSAHTSEECDLEYDTDTRIYIQNGLKLFAEYFETMWT
jgi:hypothetical protein